MGKLVTEELLTGEVLKVLVLDPACADPFVGQVVNVLEEQQPHHEARGVPGRPFSLNNGASSSSIQSQSTRPADLTAFLYRSI